MNNMRESWNWFASEVHATACAKGWWVPAHGQLEGAVERSLLECLGLVYSELGEAVEGFRSPRCSKTILGHSEACEELADVIVRIADMSQHFDIDPWEHCQWVRDHADLFDDAVKGNDEDRFVCCIDVIMEQAPAPAAYNPIEHIAIISAHLGEAVFATCYANGMDMADSLADVIISVCKLAHAQRFDLGEALLAKHAYNQSRSYRHGAKLY